MHCGNGRVRFLERREEMHTIRTTSLAIAGLLCMLIAHFVLSRWSAASRALRHGSQVKVRLGAKKT